LVISSEPIAGGRPTGVAGAAEPGRPASRDHLGHRGAKRRRRNLERLLLELVLLVEHRPLERLGLRQHPVPVDRLLVGREDVEVAVAQHPAEHALLQDRVVDLLERAVGGGPVEHASTFMTRRL
jgi:hypothetical protein